MTRRRLTNWAVAAGVAVALLGTPLVARSAPIPIGALSFEWSNEPVDALFSVYNGTDALLVGTLTVTTRIGEIEYVWTGDIDDLLDSAVGLTGNNTWTSDPFDPANVVRAVFAGSLGSFHLIGGPVYYVPNGPAGGGLPDGDGLLLGGFAPLVVDAEEGPDPIPEPASLTLFATGAALLLRARRKARRS